MYETLSSSRICSSRVDKGGESGSEMLGDTDSLQPLPSPLKLVVSYILASFRRGSVSFSSLTAIPAHVDNVSSRSLETRRSGHHVQRKVRAGNWWITHRGTSGRGSSAGQPRRAWSLLLLLPLTRRRGVGLRRTQSRIGSRPSGTPTLGPAAPSRDLSCYPVQRPGSG